MKRKAFLEKINGMWLDDFVYISLFPLYNRGFEIVEFDSDDLENTLNPSKEDIIIGSVQSTEYFFKKIGMEIPKYLGYPESLKPYMGRNVYKTKFGDIDSKFPYFIKPSIGVKSFTGTLIESEDTIKFLKDFDNLNNDTEVWYSDAVDFITEYRCFVHKDELVGIKNYTGDFKVFPDVSVINNMISAYKGSPCSYTLDVGVDNNGNTLLVEVNDMWAIGSYGLDGKTYVRMCIDRLIELKGKYIK
jgi:hypothetical protein